MPDARAIPCPRCGAVVGEWCPGTLFGVKGNAICHDRDHAWQEAGRPSLETDWKLALAWYMFHVWHCEGITYVRKGNGMNCMPPKFKAAIQEVEREWEARSAATGWTTKPDGSVW